jgi:hypothetical protein
MHTQMPTWLGSIALGAFVAGCHVSHTKVVGPPPATFFVIPEVEVNDFAWAPQSIGLVHAGETIVLEGAITDQGWDPRDGYRFVAQQSLVVDVALDAHVPGVDLDWCVWDPYIGDYTVCAETGIDPEIGSFLVPAGAEFHLVVSSYSGTSTYSMDVHFSAYFGALASGAPAVKGALAGLDQAQILPLEQSAQAPQRHDVDRAYNERDRRTDSVTGAAWLKVIELD